MVDKLVKQVGVRISVEGVEDAKLKISSVAAKAGELSRLNPTITPQIDKAKALLEAKLLRDGLRAELSKGITVPIGGAGAAGGAAGISGLVTPITALVAAGVALSPILVTLTAGAAGFGAAVYGAISPVLKAAQATGGLAANMSKLTGPQQQVAKGFLSLESSFGQFSKALQPQVFSAINGGLGIAKTLLKEGEPVAKGFGAAIDQVLASVNKGLQGQEWRQFFGWMAANVGPDVQQVSKAVGALANALPPVLEALQPVGKELLTITTEAAQTAGGIAKLFNELDRFKVSAGGAGKSQGALSEAWHNAIGIMLPTADAASKLRAALDKSTPAASKAGSSIAKMGAAAETSAQQVTDLYNSLHKLLDPLTQNITDAVTFKNDQVALSGALKKSHDALGLHTAAQRASASAAVQAAQDALTLSQNISTSGGSAQKAAGPLRALVGELQSTGAKGGYAAKLIRELQAAIDALHGKTINISTILTTSTGAVLGVPGGGHPLAAPHAAGGWASGWSLVGERGPELMYTPGSQVYSNQQSRQMVGRDVHYHINVSALPGHDREIGRVIVEKIKKFEQGSGHGWRK